MRTALERLDRILAMVPWLLAHPDEGIADVAARFDATAEEIADDLDVLGYCGVPGYGGGDLVETSVVGDRVRVRMADFFRRPLRLGVREGLMLLLAGRALLATPGLTDPAPLRRAVERLEGWLGAAEVALDLGDTDQSLLARLQQAVSRRRVVMLAYRSAGAEQETERAVEPWAVVAAGGHWYLRGHCRRVGQARDFRLDRIRWAQVTGEHADPPPADAGRTPPAYVAGDSDLWVRLRLERETPWLLEALPGARAYGDRELAVPVRSLEWAAELVLGLGGAARVLEPVELATRVGRLADAARAQYEG